MKLPISINEHSAEPLYHQIETQLRALIISGSLDQGTLLPSIREFAAQVKCSVITIKRVYSDLENEGLLRTKQGTGTYVARVEEESRSEQLHGVINEALDHLFETAKQVHCSKEELNRLFQNRLNQIKD